MDAEQHIFAHPHLTTALNKSIQAIHASHPVRVVRVIGPPGVGKSTLLRLIEKQLIEDALQDLEAGLGRLPFIRVEAVAAEGGTFDWNDFDYRMLIAADEPLIDYKINPDSIGQHSARHRQGSTRQQRGRVDLRPALVRCLEHRSPCAILIYPEPSRTALGASLHGAPPDHAGYSRGRRLSRIQPHYGAVQSTVVSPRTPSKGGMARHIVRVGMERFVGPFDEAPMLRRIHMHLPDRFPPELLRQPLAVKLDYVRQIAISHPHLTSIGDTIMPLLNAADSPQILYLGGPTGVGKTIALARIAHQFSVQPQPQHVPPTDAAGVLHVALGSLLETTFSRNAYLHLVLQSLVAYIDTQRRPNGEQHSETHDETKARMRSPRHRRTIEIYEELIAQLRYHRPRAIILDDAQLRIRTTPHDVFAALIGVISDITVATGITHVLAGTYDLRALVAEHAHMDAETRCLRHVVHFPRYRSDILQEAQTFRAVLQTLQQQLPFEKEPQLINLADYCWEHSVGYVGILVPWIREAAAWDLRNGCSTLTATSLQRFRLSAHKTPYLRSEIEHGEAWWAAEALQSKGAGS